MTEWPPKWLKSTREVSITSGLPDCTGRRLTSDECPGTQQVAGPDDHPSSFVPWHQRFLVCLLSLHPRLQHVSSFKASFEFISELRRRYHCVLSPSFEHLQYPCLCRLHLEAIPGALSAMSDHDLYISNGTCYFGTGQAADKRYLPCGNAALSGIQACCWLGDHCLASNACWDNSSKLQGMEIQDHSFPWTDEGAS